jgi:hypothetical protein
MGSDILFLVVPSAGVTRRMYFFPQALDLIPATILGRTTAGIIPRLLGPGSSLAGFCGEDGWRGTVRDALEQELFQQAQYPAVRDLFGLQDYCFDTGSAS